MKAKDSEIEEAATHQLVALLLNNEIYGIGIQYVHTVIVPAPVTQVPRTPPFIKGIMSLRGEILPVMDLRIRFGMPPKEEDAKTRVVIVNVDGLSAGLVVDGVTEVVRLTDSQIEKPSEMLSSEAAACISGIGKISAGTEKEDSLLLILDARRVLVDALEEYGQSQVAAA